MQNLQVGVGEQNGCVTVVACFEAVAVMTRSSTMLAEPQ